jgi:hypothetical protein
MVVTPKLAAHRIKSESLIAASVTVAGYGKWPHPNDRKNWAPVLKMGYTLQLQQLI